MDETLKRRLIGAAVLAVIAIVIVPMLLDGPDWQQADDEPQVTTSRNAEGERVVSVSLNGAVPAVTPTNQQTKRVGGIPAPTSREPVNRTGSLSPSESSRGSQAASAERGVASSSSAVSSSRNRDRAADLPRSNSSRGDNGEIGRPAANSSAQSRAEVRSSASASSSRSGWVVQLATFASEENANRLVDKLRAGGWSAWIEPMTSSTGRRLQQVRVGPERSQARANSSAEQLASKYKLKPQVLELR